MAAPVPGAFAARRARAQAGIWPATLAGLSATLLGIGLARFAYTPLLPAVIAAGWFGVGPAAYLAAANLTGYLVGALGARAVARRLALRTSLRLAMVLATLAFFACATPLSFAWFFLWRFAAGCAGGVLMVLAAPAVLALVPPARRGLAGGIVFSGVGLGIAASGLLVPPLLRLGLTETWLGLGVVGAALTLASWRYWPTSAPPAAAGRVRLRGGLGALIAVYGLNAVAVVPHMVILVDYVARGLGRGMALGTACWVAFGVGAVFGPMLAGALADRVGFYAAYRLGMGVAALLIAAPLVSTSAGVLLATAAVVGAATPGMLPIALGRIHLLMPPGSDGARAGWSAATASWAIGQAAAAQLLSFALAHGASYELLFATGAATLLAALALDLVTGRPPAWQA